jgi:FlaA1/EpsC-like NDP-sugar epimerase
MRKPEEIPWDGLFPLIADSAELADFAELHNGKSILVTGAGGSIGSALVRAIATFNFSQLVLLDSSEQNLYSIHKQLSSQHIHHLSVLGSVADERCIRDSFIRFRPQVVYHAAALKHVPLGEMNPFAVIENNVFGTAILNDIARKSDVERLVLISTDKSVAPESIMGVSKRVAEMILQAGAVEGHHTTSIRLGNVLASEGSVVPLFLEQIAHGGPVTVSDPQVERYFLTMDSTVLRVLAATAGCPFHPAIAIPILSNPVKITDLAHYLIAQCSEEDIQITYTGLRPGDKLREEFVAPGEFVSHQTGSLLQWLHGSDVPASGLTQGLAELRSATNDRDLARLLAVLIELVPEYRPSRHLRERAGALVS